MKKKQFKILKNKTNSFFSVIYLSFLFVLCISYENKIEVGPQNPLKGVWSVESIKWINADTTYHLKNPQPGFLQFSDQRYSFIWTPSETERTPFNRLSELSPEEIQAGFRSIVLNAGTYSFNINQISIKAEKAKVPSF